MSKYIKAIYKGNGKLFCKGELCYIEESTIKNADGYVSVYDCHGINRGLMSLSNLFILPTREIAKVILDILKKKIGKLDAVYEDVIVTEMGIEYLSMFRFYHLIETCGNINGRKLYAL